MLSLIYLIRQIFLYLMSRAVKDREKCVTPRLSLGRSTYFFDVESGPTIDPPCSHFGFSLKNIIDYNSSLTFFYFSEVFIPVTKNRAMFVL